MNSKLYLMKTIKRLQYVAVAMIALIFFEGMMTLGTAFDFNNYNTFAWIAQAILVIACVTTALRLVEEGE